MKVARSADEQAEEERAISARATPARSMDAAPYLPSVMVVWVKCTYVMSSEQMCW